MIRNKIRTVIKIELKLKLSEVWFENPVKLVELFDEIERKFPINCCSDIEMLSKSVFIIRSIGKRETILKIK